MGARIKQTHTYTHTNQPADRANEREKKLTTKWHKKMGIFILFPCLVTRKLNRLKHKTHKRLHFSFLLNFYFILCIFSVLFFLCCRFARNPCIKFIPPDEIPFLFVEKIGAQCEKNNRNSAEIICLVIIIHPKDSVEKIVHTTMTLNLNKRLYDDEIFTEMQPRMKRNHKNRSFLFGHSVPDNTTPQVPA